MQLTPAVEKYVLHWGEMGTRWGVNRTVAQIQALLYLSPRPLHAEEIAETLSVARSNVSTSVKELQGWRLINVAHVIGDRRDHFTAVVDNWTMLMTILEERKRREIEPTLTILRQCVIEMEDDDQTPAEVKKRIANMLTFISTLTSWFDEVKGVPKATLVLLMKMGAGVTKLLSKRQRSQA
jgi:DNA-binding transcriptional regulator GbsR (MarR family)